MGKPIRILPFKREKDDKGHIKYVQMTEEEYYDSKGTLTVSKRQKHLILAALRMMSGKCVEPKAEDEVSELMDKIEKER